MGRIKSCDFFGKQFNYNIEGGTFKTFLGGLLSIFFGLSTLVLAWYFGIDIYEKKHPFYLETTSYYDFNPLIKNYNYTQTFISFGLYNDLEDNDNLRFVEHIAYHDYKVLNRTTNKLKKIKRRIPAERCSPKYTEHYDYLKTFEFFDTSFCFNPEPQEYPDFGGPDFEGEKNYITLNVRFCNEETEQTYNITCASKEERDRLYKPQKQYIKVFYQHNLIDPSICFSNISH